MMGGEGREGGGTRYEWKVSKRSELKAAQRLIQPIQSNARKKTLASLTIH